MTSAAFCPVKTLAEYCTFFAAAYTLHTSRSSGNIVRLFALPNDVAGKFQQRPRIAVLRMVP